MSRRDDLECLGYTIMQLVEPSKVPWSEITSKEEILRLKVEFLNTPEHLLPTPKFIAIHRFIHYCASLDYTADPDYQLLTSHLKNSRAISTSTDINKIAKLLTQKMINRYACSVIKSSLKTGFETENEKIEK